MRRLPNTVSVIKLDTYRVAARSAKRRVMSTTSSNPLEAVATLVGEDEKGAGL
jgi:hypothetical protein